MSEENNDADQKLSALGARLRYGLAIRNPLSEEAEKEIKQTILEAYMNRLGEKVEKLEKQLRETPTQAKTPPVVVQKTETLHDE